MASVAYWVLTGTFRWNKFAKLGCINLSNRRLKTVTYGRQVIHGFGFGRTQEKFTDSDANSESVTTLGSTQCYVQSTWCTNAGCNYIAVSTLQWTASEMSCLFGVWEERNCHSVCYHTNYNQKEIYSSIWHKSKLQLGCIKLLSQHYIVFLQHFLMSVDVNMLPFEWWLLHFNYSNRFFGSVALRA